MKKFLFAAATLIAGTSTAHASIISVVGPNSNLGAAPSIIAAPTDALDDIVTNTGMQGFDEAQSVTTTVAHAHDFGVIPEGTIVDSHMIFLNSLGNTRLSHYEVFWTFDGDILGVMSDGLGNLEAASTFELGSPTTNYTVTFPSSGPAAPFTARGMEGNRGCNNSNDGYAIISSNTLCVSMLVTEPGDWIRVVTATPVPVPAALPLLLLGVGGLGFMARRKKTRHLS